MATKKDPNLILRLRNVNGSPLSLKGRVTAREKNAIDVIERAARFDPQAMSMARDHVESYPSDVYVLAHLLGPFVAP